MAVNYTSVTHFAYQEEDVCALIRSTAASTTLLDTAYSRRWNLLHRPPEPLSRGRSGTGTIQCPHISAASSSTVAAGIVHYLPVLTTKPLRGFFF